MKELYKILLRDNINQRFVTILNQEKDKYLNNLKVCREAEQQLKCNIIFNGISTDKEDLMQVEEWINIKFVDLTNKTKDLQYTHEPHNTIIYGKVTYTKNKTTTNIN